MKVQLIQFRHNVGLFLRPIGPANMGVFMGQATQMLPERRTINDLMLWHIIGEVELPDDVCGDMCLIADRLSNLRSIVNPILERI